MAIWFFIGVDTMAFGERIAPMSAKTYFEPLQSASTAFSGTRRAALFGDGCGRSLTARSRTTFGGRTDNPMPKAAPMPTSVSRKSRMAILPAHSEVGDQEMAIIVNKTLDLIRPEFEERTWQAFWRSAVEGQSSAVVAEALEMTPGAVRQAKSRVLRRLRGELHQLLELEGCSLEGVRSS